MGLEIDPTTCVCFAPGRELKDFLRTQTNAQPTYANIERPGVGYYTGVLVVVSIVYEWGTGAGGSVCGGRGLVSKQDRPFFSSVSTLTVSSIAVYVLLDQQPYCRQQPGVAATSCRCFAAADGGTPTRSPFRLPFSFWNLPHLERPRRRWLSSRAQTSPHILQHARSHWILAAGICSTAA